MDRRDVLKAKIEKERSVLNQLVAERKLEESYQQSRVVDQLIEEYINMTC